MAAIPVRKTVAGAGLLTNQSHSLFTVGQANSATRRLQITNMVEVLFECFDHVYFVSFRGFFNRANDDTMQIIVSGT
ncbi:hypothetical protein Pan241w_07700 [Gimesia alba]|uniref:Uncharacterized protein n=1 Tax=Gimesia alba TaxID=2527973 RepID=A0A517R9Z4_9PLAN|nr:hypothetical protein [Gimesia alba]QDT40712.1 hypothetical protein Pan241w_07700 [Gimesia alba]